MQAVHASLKANVQMQIGGFCGVLLQYGKRNVMAGTHGEQLMTRVARVGEYAAEAGAQRLDVRLHARACAPLGPQQSLRKLRGPRPLALRPDDQGFAQSLFPPPQRAPDVPVRTPERLRGVTYRALLEHGRQQAEERVAQVCAALLAGLECIAKVQAQRGLAVGVHRRFCMAHPAILSSFAVKPGFTPRISWRGRLCPHHGLQSLMSPEPLGRGALTTAMSIP
jgi:hypothetical protein